MPTDFFTKTMALKSQECSQTKQYVIEPRLTPSNLRAFDQTKLFDCAMILLNSVSLFGKIFMLFFRHFNQTCRPMLRAAVWFIQSRIIENQNAGSFLNLCFSLLPERFGIGFKPKQQASKSIMCRSVSLSGCTRAASVAVNCFGEAMTKLM